MVIDQSIERRLGRLRIWNIAVGLVLAVQAIMIAILTNSFSLPVTATFMSGPPGTAPELQHLFNISIGWGVFAFLAISAGALLIIASPLVFPWYKRNPTTESQLRALDRVLLQLFDYDRVNLSDYRNQRYCSLTGHLRHQRLYDPIRRIAGEI